MSPIPHSQKTILPNGLKIITERVSSVRSVSLGIFVGCGSNLESPEESGISHLIEHMNFKGTPTRTAFQIAEELDAIGGKINAYTSKEYTCFYAITLDKHVQIAVNVLADLFLNSLYNPTELDLEKGVVLEEIKMSEDAPDEHSCKLSWPGTLLEKISLAQKNPWPA
ncbi:MAG: pitrilysin family protein [Candidatus Saganbacteria bacterium]|nr:pitrilysin family protein [Candidatus Saganbacteria bacterium]